MMYKISFLKKFSEPLLPYDKSIIVDQLGSWYSCPASWNYQIVFTTDSAGFTCTKPDKIYDLNKIMTWVENLPKFDDMILINNLETTGELAIIVNNYT